MVFNIVLSFSALSDHDSSTSRPILNLAVVSAVSPFPPPRLICLVLPRRSLRTFWTLACYLCRPFSVFICLSCFVSLWGDRSDRFWWYSEYEERLVRSDVVDLQVVNSAKSPDTWSPFPLPDLIQENMINKIKTPYPILYLFFYRKQSPPRIFSPHSRRTTGWEIKQRIRQRLGRRVHRKKDGVRGRQKVTPRTSQFYMRDSYWKSACFIWP